MVWVHVAAAEEGAAEPVLDDCADNDGEEGGQTHLHEWVANWPMAWPRGRRVLEEQGHYGNPGAVGN